MKLAKLKESFSIIQWHGDEYPYYESDASDSLQHSGDEVEVLKKVGNNKLGDLYIIYNPRVGESTVISENYLEFI